MFRLTTGILSIDPAEAKAIRGATNALAATIRDACIEAGVTFVDVRPAFDGHSCGVDEEEGRWINCVIPPNADDRLGQGFHPNEVGNEAYKDAVRAHL